VQPEEQKLVGKKTSVKNKKSSSISHHDLST